MWAIWYFIYAAIVTIVWHFFIDLPNSYEALLFVIIVIFPSIPCFYMQEKLIKEKLNIMQEIKFFFSAFGFFALEIILFFVIMGIFIYLLDSGTGYIEGIFGKKWLDALMIVFFAYLAYDKLIGEKKRKDRIEKKEKRR